MSSLESSVSAVVVFQRGAAVTRTAVAKPRAGAVVFDGLPLCLDDDSVRITLGEEASHAGWAVTDLLLDVDAPSARDAPTPDDREAVKAAEDERDRAQARLDATQASIDALRGVELRPRASVARDQRPTHDPTAGRLAWLDLQAQTLGELYETLREQEHALEDAEEALRAQLDAFQASSSDRAARAHEPRKRVVLTLQAGEALDTVPIELTYRVPGARWAPAYVLRLGEADEARLELRAVVAQQTREDWSGARLTVSTASWQAWHDLPKLDALRVGRAQPTPARAGWREPPPDPEGLYRDFDSAMSKLPPDPQMVLVGAAGAVAEPEPAKPVPVTASHRRMDANKKKRSKPKPPPMPPPAAAPAPASFGAPADAPMPQSAPGRARSKAAAPPPPPMEGAAMADEAEDFYAEEPEAPPEPGHGLGRAWFDYGRLRLPLPSDAGRGRLRRVSVAESSGGDAEALHAAVRSATNEARALAGVALPDGHSWVSAREGHAYAYVCEAEVHIPSDGQGHVVTVLEAGVEVSRRYVCVPGISADVFRTLAARNPLPQPLPAGPLDVYEREVFKLTGSLDATGSAARFEVGLGVEQSIKVARNVTFSEESEGLIKKHNAYTHRIAIDVRNLLPTAAALELRERVPVPESDEEDVEVTESRVEPPWDHWEPTDDPLEGGRRWRLEVPPGEERSVVATWAVRVPGGSELVGGNRRDA